MPKGLYFTVVISSFFLSFFRRLISEVTRRISTKLAHSLMTIIRKIWSELPGHLAPRAGEKTLFGTDFEL